MTGTPDAAGGPLGRPDVPSSLEVFRALARYNTRANVRLYDACAQLTEADLKADRQAFFRSIHGTLNHILLGDTIWMTRFGGGSMPSTDLDAILHESFDDLRAARTAMDARIEAFADGLDPGFLGRPLRYRNSRGIDREDDPFTILMHFFNHQTHHRGQVHDMLSRTPVLPPSLDLHQVLKPDQS